VLHEPIAGAEVMLDDKLLDQIDEIVAPGAEVAPLDGAAYSPPFLMQASPRRRSVAERAAARRDESPIRLTAAS
jgi:hypothetical protein